MRDEMANVAWAVEHLVQGALENRLERVAEHGELHLVRQPPRLGAPLHVEPRRVPRRRPVRQQVVPVRIVRADPHMVRHDVEHEPHPVRVRRVGQRDERRVAAELRVHVRRIGDVVPVRAPRPRRQHR